MCVGKGGLEAVIFQQVTPPATPTPPPPAPPTPRGAPAAPPGGGGGGLDPLWEKWSVSITDHFWPFFPKWVQPPPP